MSRAALIRRALLGGAALTGIGAGNAASAKSREEDRETFDKRTGSDQIDYAQSRAFRDRMTSVAQGVFATAALSPDAPPQVKRIASSPALERVKSGEPARLSDYRQVLDAYASTHPEAAAGLRAEFKRFEPQRDRDVDEKPLAALGGAAGALAGLVATRGKGGGLQRLGKRALAATGLAAAGGGLGAAAANDIDATLSGDDMGDIGKAAGAAGAVGLAAIGARAGVKRLARNAVVRGARIRQATPAIDAATPAMDARDIARTSRSEAKRGVKHFESDADILAADILHMERTLERAGMKRRFTALDDPKALARKLRREDGWDDMQDALDALERDYRAALSKLKVKQIGAPSLRRDAPEVTDPRDRDLIDAGVSKGLATRQRRSEGAKKRRKRTGNANPVSAVKPKGRGR